MIIDMGKKTRVTLAPDKVAHANLRRLWDEKKDVLNLNQEKAAALMERSQGLVGQYLNGIIPLGTVATLKFARLLQCKPTDIRPDFSFGTLIPGEIPSDVVEIAIKLSTLPEPARRDAIGFLNVVLANKGYIDLVQHFAAPIHEKKPAKTARAAH